MAGRVTVLSDVTFSGSGFPTVEIDPTENRLNSMDHLVFRLNPDEKYFAASTIIDVIGGKILTLSNPENIASLKGTWNSKPAYYFNEDNIAISDTLDIFPANTSSYTIIFAMKSESSMIDFRTAMSMHPYSAVTRWSVQAVATKSVGVKIIESSTEKTMNATAWGAASRDDGIVVTMTWNTSTGDFKGQTNNATPVTTASVPAHTQRSFVLGGLYTPVVKYMKGYIGDVFIFEADFNDGSHATEKAYVINYLATKYGISL